MAGTARESRPLLKVGYMKKPYPYLHKKRERVLASIIRGGFKFDKWWIEILCDIGLIVQKSNGYAVIRPYRGSARGKLRVARLITMCPEGLMVDHINRVREDNRSINLRVVTMEQNRKNLSKYKTYKYQGPKKKKF